MPTLYNTSSQEGVDINDVFILNPTGTPEYPRPPFLPGTLAYGSDGSEWVYCTASITITAGSVVVVSAVPASWSVALIGGATIASAPTGQLAGVAGGGTGSVAIPAPTGTQTGTFFWVQRGGNAPNVRCEAATTVNAQLYMSKTTGGRVTSTSPGAASGYAVNGIVITQATGSAAGPNTAVLNFPVIGAEQ